MKNKLQYAYSITVFLGVLISAYLMMNTDGNTQLPLRAFQSATYRTEALVVDPAVNQLFEMEGALSALPKTNSETKRTPSKVSNSD